MGTDVTDATRGAAPDPGDVVSVDDLAARLQELRVWAGVSYRELHRRVLRSRQQRNVPERPSFDSVHRCLQPGRKRLDPELVVDIAGVLLGDRESAQPWRQACRVVSGAQTAAGLVTVTELPTDPARFVGRSRELAGLRTAVGSSWGRLPTVLSVRGMGGVGKTSLATRLARSVAMRFDATGLAVDLRGYDPSLPPADPAAVLDGLLRRLGLAGNQIAGMDLGHRSTTFRTMVRGRPLVLLLDNAAGPDQVLPLLPGTPTSLVLITSRDIFELPGARVLDLDPMNPGDAVELLAERSGGDQVAGDPEMARQLVDLVGHLPLAIDLLGSRIASAPDWMLADHIERLREATQSRHLDDAVDATLRLSYEALGDDQRRLLRALALHPGPEFDGYAAAALVDRDLASVTAGLHGLVARSLLLSPQSGRYRLHDLVRTFAAGRVREEDPASRRREAQRRLCSCYTRTAVRAARLHAPETRSWLRAEDQPGIPDPELDDAAAATAWLETEATALLGIAWQAVEYGWVQQAAGLAMAIHWYLYVSGRTAVAEPLLRRVAELTEGITKGRALTAAAAMAIGEGRYADAEAPTGQALAIYRESGDLGLQSAALNNLGIIAHATGRTEEASRRYAEALALAEQTGDPGRQLHPVDGLGRVEEQRGNVDRALAYYQRAEELAAELGDPIRQVQTGLDVANVLQELGHNVEAVERSEAQLALARSVGYVDGEIHVLATIGVARSALGDHANAIPVLDEALALARDHGLGLAELQVLVDLGRALIAAGRADDAVARLQQAAGLAERLGQPEWVEEAREVFAEAERAAAATAAT